jgi:hypothetical protein
LFKISCGSSPNVVKLVSYSGKAVIVTLRNCR